VPTSPTTFDDESLDVENLDQKTTRGPTKKRVHWPDEPVQSSVQLEDVVQWQELAATRPSRQHRHPQRFDDYVM